MRLSRPLFLPLPSTAESRRIAELLRNETVGGVLVLAATAAALVWANSPFAASYGLIRDFELGPASLHLRLSLGEWAADGLLAIFFFVVGLELKREFVDGELREFARAIVPIASAVGGMLVPALLFVAVNLHAPAGSLRAWAVPTATDIAFALAVLTIVNTHLPNALRTFLLTLAVVDDLLAVIVIGAFYTHGFNVVPLLLAIVPLALFLGLMQWRVWSPLLLIPACLVWALVHASGVHATIAGVLLGLTVPVSRSDSDREPESGGLAEHLERRFRPLSAGLAVPVFALLTAGVQLGGWRGASEALSEPPAVGVILALVIGKPVGILGSAYLLSHFTRAELAGAVKWRDVAGIAALGGVGFTVSLLIGQLSFGEGDPRREAIKLGVLVASVCAAAIGAALLRLRNNAYRRLIEAEALDPTDATTAD